MTPGAGERIPHSRFCFDALPPRDRFSAWSESISPLFRPQLAADTSPCDVSVDTEVFMLGNALLGRSETKGVGGYESRGNGATRDQSEAVLVQLYLSGGFTGHNGKCTMNVAAGDLVVIDTARALTTNVSDSAILSFILSREGYHAALGHAFAGPRVIPGSSAAGRILANAFHEIWRTLPEARAAEANALSGLLLGAVAGVLNGSARDGADTPAAVAADLATLDAMRRWIEEHLTDPELGPEQLCRQFNCSRATLYRHFAPLDGVANFIRHARLERAYGELLTASERIPIVHIAMQWGFGNFSHFYRLFRQTFGITPGEARAMGRAAREARQRGPAGGRIPAARLPQYREWMLRL